MEKPANTPLIRLRAASPYRLGLGVVFLLSLLGLQFLFGDMFYKPNAWLLSDNGDGLKSYFVSVYHIRYDSAYSHTLAMNYPFGEHLQYTDCQPALTNTLKLLNSALPGIADYFPGILHLLLMAGILGAALLLYDILMMLGIPWRISTLWAIGIVFLSPQVERLQGHYSLAYVFVIPMAIALLMRASRKEKPVHGILYALLMVWSGFTHLYFSAFLLLLLLAYTGRKLSQRTSRSRMSAFYGLPLWSLAAFAGILLFQQFSDPFAGRTAFPYGFLYYKAFPESVFLPLRQSYGAVFHSLSEFRYITWEGYAYTGLCAFGITLYFFFRGFRQFIRLKFRQIFHLTSHPLLNYLLWASIAGLIFSFALPFRFLPQWTVELLGPLKQFRGSGRFSWPFFYLINITAVLMLWQWRQKSTVGKVVLLMATVVLLSEALYSLDSQRNVLKNQRSPNDLPVHSGNKSLRQVMQKYPIQSILYLPYYHIGSENIWMNPAPGTLKNSFYLALESGLPLMNVMLGRTSLEQTRMSVSLVLQPAGEPEIRKVLRPDKPVLLVSEAGIPVRPGEAELLKRAIPVTIPGMPSNTACSLLFPDSVRFFRPLYYNGEAQQMDVARKTLLREIRFHPLQKDSLVEISFGLSGWMEDVVSRTNLIIHSINQSGQEEEILNQAIFNYYDQAFGNRIRVKVPLTLKPGTMAFQVWLHNPEKRRMVVSVESKTDR